MRSIPYVYVLAVLAWFGLSVVACASQQKQREICYGTAESAALVAAQEQCFALGNAWSACPARDQILADLKKAEASCP